MKKKFQAPVGAVASHYVEPEEGAEFKGGVGSDAPKRGRKKAEAEPTVPSVDEKEENASEPETASAETEEPAQTPEVKSEI